MLFIIVSDNENIVSENTFFKSSPDLIAVFTGDLGRIPFALEKAQLHKETQLFITGVYSKNSINSILSKYREETPINQEQMHVDYLARNTVENVLSTLRFLRSQDEINRILVISHDYHIMRIKLIMENLKAETDPYEFYYSGVKTDYTNLRNLKVLYKEVYKLIRTYGFLLFWNSGQGN
ncbi:MAG: YdcF family protein [Bacteriovoracaceae bacterium]